MPIVKFIKNEKQNASAMKGAIDYCLQKFKTVDSQTGKRYVSGINCNGLNAYKEFMTTKFTNHADNGRYFYQYVQSFSPKDNVDYDKAHKIALEFAEKAWQGHEVLVTTHCDRNHIHTHFIINSVSFETGKKLRQNPNTLKSLRKLNDEICTKYDIAPLKPYTKTKEKRLSDGEYRMAMKGESWKFALMYTIDNAMKRAKTKKEFVDEMKRNGYEVLWTDDRKYITYTCPNGMKCRDIKLHQEKYRKEKMSLSLNYEELKQKNAPKKATANDMIAKMEQASQVTIVESDYWKALIQLNRNQNQELSIMSKQIESKAETGSVTNMLNSAITIINRKMEEKTDSMKSELKEHQNEMEKQAGKMNESMLSVTEQTNSLLNQLKKKWIPIFFGTMIGVQVFFQTVSILLEIYLK